MIEACDGARSSPTKPARSLQCTRWKIAWREGGTVWGMVTADSYDEVVAQRERQLGFARRYARFFELPLDERYADPGPPICDTCSSEAPAGRWGEGQKFGDAEARRAITQGEADLKTLDEALEKHLPQLDDAARLAREAKTAKAARSYAQQLRQAVFDLARSRLALDNAAVFRSAKTAQEVSTTAKRRVEALTAGLSDLQAAVAREVARSHGGRYLEDGAQGDVPHLQVGFEGAKVTATYQNAAGSSVWFEGTVGLDGGISGQSLVAPEKGTLSCNEHKESCGFVYVPAVLRFSVRESDGQTREVAELWFRQSQWIQAKPFSR